ncbi:MAG: hypothetical protein IPO40_01130 [Fibrobacteres bacterium]|nr:hypothetical protein [Fibrobacterota bacterium]
MGPLNIERRSRLGNPQDQREVVPEAIAQAHAHHPRVHAASRWVYPVLSRRSGGISIGVNLNPDKVCNYDCPYCQVDRRGPAPSSEVDPAGVQAELDSLLVQVRFDGLADVFPGVDASRRKLADIALSGDGEPTSRREFPEVCRLVASARRRWIQEGGDPFRLVVITNATLLERAHVREGLGALCADGAGEIWGKLDAGTQEFHQVVNASRVSLDRVVAQLADCPSEFPLRIQTLFFRYHDLILDPAEIQAWMDRLRFILDRRPLAGLQLHTVARATARSGCHPLPVEWLQQVADQVRNELGLFVEVHGGIESGSIQDPGGRS